MLITASHVLAELSGDLYTPIGWGLAMYSGPQPQRSTYEYNNDVRSGASIYNAHNVTIASGGKKILALNGWGTPVVMVATDKRLEFKFSQAQVVGVSLDATPPTWALLMLGPLTAGNLSSNDAYTNTGIFLTVGDENSDADIKIVGGKIPVGQKFSLNDVTVNLAGLVY